MEVDALAEIVDQLRAVDLLAVRLRVLLGLVRERGQKQLCHAYARPVRRRALRVRLAPYLVQLARGQLQDFAAINDLQLRRRFGRGVAQRAQKHLSHPQRTLDRSQCGCVLSRRFETVEHFAERAQLYVRFAHRRQHSRDVRGEDARRTDHENARAAELTAVPVQQVRGTVQRDGRLAGARTAGDFGDAAPRRADDLVLFLLDRGHDVAHLLAARTAERGHQRALADDLHVLGHGVGDQHVVVHVQHRLPGAADHPAAHDVHRLFGGGLVEGGGRGRAPVGDQVVELGVADAETADVDVLAVEVVEPAEDQALVLGVERLQGLVRVVDHHVALEQHRRLLEDRFALCALAQLVALGPHRLGLGPQLGEPRVDPVDVCLLDGDLSPSHPGFRHATLP